LLEKIFSINLSVAGSAQPTIRWIMPHFWLTYGKAGRIIGVVIIEAPTMVQARMYAAVGGIIDAGAPFVEGHKLSAKLMASIPPSQIDRKMSGAEAAQLIRLLEGRREPEK
jgi:hypothetical protein